MPTDLLSIVIPVYRNDQGLQALVGRIESALKDWIDLDKLELILVDDGSPDNSWAVISDLVKVQPWIVGIKLRRNFGQHNAIMAGLTHAHGSLIVLMDDDLQHSPMDIPKIVALLNQQFDVVYAQFYTKHHALWKIIGSKLNNFIAVYLLDKPKNLYFSPFKGLRSEIRDELIKYSGPFVYLDGLIMAITQNIGVVRVEHHPRSVGESGYSVHKSISLWLKMATLYSVWPLRIAGLIGFILAFGGVLLALYLILGQLFSNGPTPPGWTSLIVVSLLLGGGQLIFLGVIGEYLGRSYTFLNHKPQYIIEHIQLAKPE
ncbi:MAG: Undecaprenyl-phosphate 4-deoxy-4-formamido-L-arabinose transferase [Syntrophus sp. PtaB.Bin075]|nr:MAG: Undecaprenyl-phosphate 4-deoxy-4-formamido-L-arabinose transferase [Syntrophus sp. PtaB.Bin075]